jgi:hypothetical protein
MLLLWILPGDGRGPVVPEVNAGFLLLGVAALAFAAFVIFRKD